MQRHIPAAHFLLVFIGISFLLSSCAGPLAFNNHHYGRGMYVKANKETSNVNNTRRDENLGGKSVVPVPERRASLNHETPNVAMARSEQPKPWKPRVYKHPANQTTTRVVPTANVINANSTNIFTTVPLYQHYSADPVTGSVSFLLMVVGIVFIVLGAVFFVIGSWVLGVLLGLVGLVFFLLSLLL